MPIQHHRRGSTSPTRCRDLNCEAPGEYEITGYPQFRTVRVWYCLDHAVALDKGIAALPECAAPIDNDSWSCGVKTNGPKARMGDGRYVALCEEHYKSWQKYGDPFEASRRKDSESRNTKATLIGGAAGVALAFPLFGLLSETDLLSQIDVGLRTIAIGLPAIFGLGWLGGAIGNAIAPAPDEDA